MSENDFSGPIFVVGLSRSGTTLLLDILNRNPRIAMPGAESHFIPWILHRYGEASLPLGPTERAGVERFFKSSMFCREMKRRGRAIDDAHLAEILAAGSWERIFEGLLRFYANGPNDQNFIWGDKTPTYVNHLALIKSKMPGARFLHIVRDPRDRALSAMKAWGANIYLSSDLWRSTIERARVESHDLGADYREVFFEHLITNPRDAIDSLCRYLGVSFDEDMLAPRLSSNSPSQAGARGQSTAKIVATNRQKFLRELSSRQVRRIDQIVHPVAGELGYAPLHPNIDFVPLNGVEKAFYLLLDRLNSAVWYARRWGLLRGISYGLWRAIGRVRQPKPSARR